MSISRGGLGVAQLEVASRTLDEYWTPCGWPAGAVQVGQPCGTSSISRYGITSRANFLTLSGAGTQLVEIALGMPFVRFVAPKIASLEAVAPAQALLSGGLPTGISPGVSPMTPLIRWLALVRLSALGGTNGLDMGFTAQVRANATPAQVGVAGGQGFGFVGDGAGGWQFVARATLGGPLTIQQPITWPGGDVRSPAVLELRVYPPSANSSAAILEARINGDVILTESWANGRLPLYTALANSCRLSARLDITTPALGADLLVHSVRAIYSEIAPAD